MFEIPVWGNRSKRILRSVWELDIVVHMYLGRVGPKGLMSVILKLKSLGDVGIGGIRPEHFPLGLLKSDGGVHGNLLLSPQAHIRLH